MKSIQKPGLQLLNTVFFNKYRLVEKLGEGTFGMIFKCESTDGLCAFKFEKKRYGRRSLLKAESEVMIELKGFGIPKIISYIENDDYNIMIMELLGKSLEVLAQQYADEKLSLKTCCMLGIEMLKILKKVHDNHFIHRDIKPDNFAIGYSDQSQLYLIDFGLAKQYRNAKTLQQKPMQKNKKLTGTARYASINALRGYDQSRRDDLESIGYVLAYLLRGNLPWQGIVVKTKEEKYAKILYRKQSITSEQLFFGFPNELCTYINYCKNLGYEEEPKYDYLTDLFKNIIQNQLHEEIDYKYDWLQNDIDLNVNIKENYISVDGGNENDLNNLSMVNNLSNSFSNSRNSLSGFNLSFNDNNLDTGYYDEAAEEINNKKDNKILEKQDNIIQNEIKKKKGTCCCNIL
jgi:serine/threonine protein kinase